MNIHEYESEMYEFPWIRYEIHELYEYEFRENMKSHKDHMIRITMNLMEEGAVPVQKTKPLIQRESNCSFYFWVV